MQVESDMHHIITHLMANFGISLPILINSSSQKAFDQIKIWVNDEISEITGNGKESEKVRKIDNSYLNFLLANENVAKVSADIITSHICHVIISLFPTLTAVTGWTLAEPYENNTKESVRATVKQHLPVISHHLISNDEETVLDDGIKLKNLTSVAVSPLFLSQSLQTAFKIEDIVPLKKCERIVTEIAEQSSVVFERMNGEIFGNGIERNHDHFGMPWATGFKILIHVKKE